jgi:DNA-binding winged helix-turn-helix (wHTH) protein/tetratricopeptide (TPR) repeat protein
MTKQNFVLNGWVVDVAGGRITQDDQTTHLEPKIMSVLAYLASRPNEVVAKDQLVEAVWNHSCVSDAALTRCIFEIRQAFGDNAREPTVIETIPKIGYRLVATPQRLRNMRGSGRRPMQWLAAAIIAAFAMFVLTTQVSTVDAGITDTAEQVSDNALANRAYHQGMEHFEAQSYIANQNAITLFRSAIEHDPSFGLAYARLSDSLSQQVIRWGGDSLDEARDTANKAIELEPLNAQSHNALGVTQLLSKKTDSALESFRRANELDPSHWISLYNAAITHMRRFEYADAKVLLMRVLEFQPEHYEAMGRLGYVHLRIGNIDKSRFWLNKTLEYAPESIIARTQLAILELVTRDVSKAIDNCERVTDIFPEHETCLHISGMGHLMAGNTDEANRIFDFVIENLAASDYAQLGKAKILLSNGQMAAGVDGVNAVLDKTLLNLPGSEDPWRESRIIAASYSLLGDRENGLIWLKKSTESGRHFPLWDATDPVFANLHDDHQFNRFIALAMHTKSN